MKRVEITAPKQYRDDVEDTISAHTEDITTSVVEKDDRAFVRFEVALDADEIDEVTEELKDIKELETGDLTIEVLEQTARIEKGKRRKGGTSTISVQEMYEKAFEFATFDSGHWALIALGAGIAVFGATMDNVMVVIGSMVITPMLGPFIAAAFGLVIGDRKLIQDSSFYGLLSILLAISAAYVIALVMPTTVNPVIRMIADPGFATIPLSLFVGAAAALTFTTEMRESLAGVAVAIALVPPAAVVGIALSLLNLELFLDVSLVLLTNILSLVLAASVTFKLLNIEPSTYYRQKVSQEQLRKALLFTAGSILVIGGIVAAVSYQDLRDSYERTQVETFIDTTFGDRVLKQEVDVSQGEITVTLVVIDPADNAASLEQQLERLVARDVTVKLLGVQSNGVQP